MRFIDLRSAVAHTNTELLCIRQMGIASSDTKKTEKLIHEFQVEVVLAVASVSVYGAEAYAHTWGRASKEDI